MGLLEFVGTNTTGWSELYDGNMILAAFTMYDTAFLGWSVAILFFVYQFMLYIKTQNVALCFTTGALFTSLYVGSTFVKPITQFVMFTLLVIEVAAIAYIWVWKK